MPPPVPLYDPASASGAYSLRYAWTGWCSGPGFPADTVTHIQELRPSWETDGLRPLKHRIRDNVIQILFSATPQISPLTLATRAKGRLSHAFRDAGTPVPFTRKVAVCSVGENTRDAVESYIADQVSRADFADSRWEAAMKEFIFDDPGVDLSVPQESARGRYWYGLHIVLVTGERVAFSDVSTLRMIRDGSLRIAEKKGLRISRLAVMPDHLHLAVGPPPGMAPVEVIGTFQNNLAWMLGQQRVWSNGYYTGTFGDYDMGAVRLLED